MTGAALLTDAEDGVAEGKEEQFQCGPDLGRGRRSRIDLVIEAMRRIEEKRSRPGLAEEPEEGSARLVLEDKQVGVFPQVQSICCSSSRSRLRRLAWPIARSTDLLARGGANAASRRLQLGLPHLVSQLLDGLCTPAERS